MGKAQITGGGAKGLYAIRVLYARDRVQAAIAKIDAALSLIATRAAALAAEIAAAQAAYDAAKADPATPFSQLATLAAALYAKQMQQSLLTLESSSKETKKRQLQSIPADPDASAWCADLTETLTGVVGTIEPNGEPGGYIIRPGHDNRAAYSAQRDGQLQPVLANTPEGAFFNKALMPGWQKWHPTYRVGTITDLDVGENTCAVALDAATSREQGLAINLAVGICPIEYMT